MITHPDGSSVRDALRWGGALVTVAALHLGGVVLLLRAPPPFEPPAAAPEAVLMELPAPEPAPEPAAAPAPEPPAAPEPPQPAPLQPAPPEPPPPEPPPPPLPEPPPPPPPPPPRVEPPKPVVKPPPKPVVRPPPPRPRPPRVDETAPAPVAPSAPPAPLAPAAAPAAPAAPSGAVLNWRGQISARLARAKRYPDQLRSQGIQGTVMCVFTVDRAGRVLSASVTRSSGSAVLDEEAVAAIRRADLPPMPPEMTEAAVTMPVPFNFFLR